MFKKKHVCSACKHVFVGKAAVVEDEGMKAAVYCMQCKPPYTYRDRFGYYYKRVQVDIDGEPIGLTSLRNSLAEKNVEIAMLQQELSYKSELLAKQQEVLQKPKKKSGK